jgi:hypothetical protein
MSSAIPTVSFHNVSLFAKEEFGISGVSFKLFGRKKYRIVVDSADQKNCILGLLENRYRPDSGLIRREDNLFFQSDRLLMGDRVISETAEEYLGMKHPQFRLDGRKRSKLFFVDELKAKQILFYPVYKLKGEDKQKFALLSLLFQSSGLILVSDLFTRDLKPRLRELMLEVFQKTGNTLCIVTCIDDIIKHEEMRRCLTIMETIALK